jgi:predicted permease
MTNVGMPFLILSSTLNIKLSSEFVGKMIFTAVMGVALLFGTFLLAALFLCKNDDEKKKRMARFCMVFPNNGFLGIPLAEAVFGDSPVMMYLIILNILNNVMMFTLGVYLISGDKKAINVKKILLNPLVIAFVLGIILNILDVKSYVPEIVSYSAHLRGLVTPLSMTVLGMKMAIVKLLKIFTFWKTYYVSFIKLILAPILIIAILLGVKFAFGLDIIDKYILLGAFMAFSMPTAGLASPIADKHQADVEGSVIYTLGTTILSIATIPILYMLLNLII